MQTIVNTAMITKFRQNAGKMASLAEKLYSFFVYGPYLSRMTPSHITIFLKEEDVIRTMG